MLGGLLSVSKADCAVVGTAQAFPPSSFGSQFSRPNLDDLVGRLALDRAMTSEPKPLRLDEPSPGLAPRIAGCVLQTERIVAHGLCASLREDTCVREAYLGRGDGGENMSRVIASRPKPYEGISAARA